MSGKDQKMNEMLSQAIAVNASDVHLSSGQLPMWRVDGELAAMPGQTAVLSDDILAAMLQAQVSQAQFEQFNSTHELDFSYEMPGEARFRVNAFRQVHGLSLVFRIIPLDIQTLQELGLPAQLQQLCELPNGLVLVTGPTGSGKSTSLAAMLNHINQHQAKHVLTMEDPIEFVHQSQQSLVQQREVGRDTQSFHAALRAALREDPDVILVGELRDLETIRLALTAAETGHLVFATLHTSSAPKTINRIIDVFPGGEKDLVRALLSDSLQAVVAQLLLPRVGGGRVAAHEIMKCSPAVRNLIRDNKIQQIESAMQTGRGLGMQTMAQCLSELAASGKISQDVSPPVSG